MDRRAFLTAVASCFVAAPLAVDGQAAPNEPRIGYLSIGSASDPRRIALEDAFRQGLHDLGYIENRTIGIDARFAADGCDRLPALAAELVRLHVAVIMAYSTPAVKAALGATKMIPIVMSGVVDPVATGLVSNLGRPGGNVTGLSLMAPELVGKQMLSSRSWRRSFLAWLSSGIRPIRAARASSAKRRRRLER